MVIYPKPKFPPWMHVVATIHHYSAGRVLVHNIIVLYYHYTFTIHTYYYTQLHGIGYKRQSTSRNGVQNWPGKLAGCDTGALFRELLRLLMSLRFVMIGNDKIYVNHY